MRAERVQELRTLCEALNLAGKGKVRGLSNVLAQRFLALEQKTLGQRDLARGLELVQTRSHALSPQGTLRISSSRLRTASTALTRSRLPAEWAMVAVIVEERM